MRILMVSHTYPKQPGDATAPFVADLAQALVTRGNYVDVLLPFHPSVRFRDTEQPRLLSYRYSPLPQWAPWGFGESLGGDSRIRRGVALLLPAVVLSLRARVRRLLREGGYDVVNAHWAIPNGWVVAPLAREARVPLVVSLHGSDVSIAERHRLLARFAKQAFRAAHEITASSDDLRLRAIALGADPASAQTIHYGVDATTFRSGAPDPELRRRIGVPDGSLLVASVGRLIEVKGFEYLIDAGSRVKGIHIAIVGDGDLREQLERRARDLETPVTFTGALAHDEVAKLIAAADVVVVPSVVDRSGRVDGLPNTVLEALASGRPLVATAVGGIPEVVTDGVNGVLVPQKDAAALAAALSRLARDPAERARLGDAGRRAALADLTWDATARAFEAAYERARRRLGARGSTGG